MQVILYTTGCPKCKVLKSKLAEKNVEYQENTSIEDMQKLGISLVPVLSVDGELMDFTKAVKYVNSLSI